MIVLITEHGDSYIIFKFIWPMHFEYICCILTFSKILKPFIFHSLGGVAIKQAPVDFQKNGCILIFSFMINRI